MSLTMHPPPTVASGLSSAYQFTTFIAEVQQPSAMLPPSTVSTAFLSPVPAFLVLKRLPCQHKSRFSLSHPPHRSTVSLSVSLTGPNTVRPLPLSHMPLPYLGRVMQPPNEALASPSVRPRYST